MEMEDRMGKRRDLTESKIYKADTDLEIKKYLRSPITPNINEKLYDERICELLASRFYTLVEEYKQMIEAHGGKNVGSISKKTSFVLAGDNMGPEKRKKAESIGIPLVSEEDFLAMLEA
jgi:hypothetical protein